MGIIQSMWKTERGQIIFFDTETTDLRPGEIAQLSYVVTNECLEPLKARNFYFTVQKMSPGASQVNGLTTEKLIVLSEGRRFDDHYQEIHSDFHQQNLVAHNVNFDMNFMQSEFSRRGVAFAAGNCFCTMKYFTEICQLPGGKTRYKYPKLAEVLQHYRIGDQEVADFAMQAFGNFNGSFHDSRFDVAALYLICKRASEEEYIEEKIG